MTIKMVNYSYVKCGENMTSTIEEYSSYDRTPAGVRLHSSWCATVWHVLCARPAAAMQRQNNSLSKYCYS